MYHFNHEETHSSLIESLKYKMILSDRLSVNLRLFSAFIFIVISAGLSAGTLKIEFEFTKIPPRTGILYFPEDGNRSMSSPLEIDQVDKHFTKILFVGTQGSMMVFKNSDSVDHNIYANDMGADVFFDIGLVEPGEESTIRMDWGAGSIIRIGCKIHPRMKSYIANIPSTHYKIFPFRREKKRYRVKMNHIPDELSQVKIWLPSYVDIDANVVIGETRVIPLLKRKRRYGTVKLIRESGDPASEAANEATHLSEKRVPKLEETFSESGKHIPERWSPKSKKSTHLSKKRVPKLEETFSESGKHIPEPERWSPRSNETTHLSEKRAPNLERTFSESGKGFPEPEKWSPKSNKATHLPKKRVPKLEKTFRQSGKDIRDTEKWFPESLEESVPKSKKLMPKSEKPVRKSEKWLPASDINQ